jgi:predicted amidophosphoribosyltransferase
MTENPEFGTRRCVCKRCGAAVAHAERGVPCTDVRCPRCGAAMTGEHCGDDTAVDTGRSGENC